MTMTLMMPQRLLRMRQQSPQLMRLCSSTQFSPVNILKEGSDPELKSAEEYPDYLQTLHQPQPTLAQLERMTERTMKEEDRFIKLINRMRIKANNTSRS